jgi:integrase
MVNCQQQNLYCQNLNIDSMEEIDEGFEKAIVKDSTRVLTPKEYKKLCEQLPPHYIAICDVLLHTGMRMPEFIKFSQHPEWYDPRRRCIELPTKAIRKKKTVYKTRQVNLTLAGCDAVKHFQKMIADNMKIPCRQSMLGVLCNAAIAAKLADGDKGICPKMFRKTMVSFLMTAFPEKMFKIASNMGHTLEVMQIHYTNLSFAPEDTDDIKKFLKGWGMTE